jgi:hypothetical protein
MIILRALEVEVTLIRRVALLSLSKRFAGLNMKLSSGTLEYVK